MRIGGRRVDGLAPRDRGIAMVFQNYAVFPHMTVFENIAFGLRMKKVPEADVDRKVRRAAGMMHIDQLLQRYSGQLSGGQRQRVAVARALAVEPAVLLMDEPLSNLDALLRLEMRAELKGVLQESKTTTIYVTHDQVEAMSLADRIAVMNRGRIVQAARATEVYADPATRFVGSFIGNPPMNFLPAEPNGAGLEVAGLTLEPPKAASGRIEFGIRPEDVEIRGDGLPGAIRVVEPLGPHKLLTVRRRRPPVPRRGRQRARGRARPGDQPAAEARPRPLVRRRDRPRLAMTLPPEPHRSPAVTFDDSTAFERAATVLSENDRGTYTVPTKGLYPFQWNWDSCLTALGQRHIDEARAWTEIETLAAHQWPDGMIPHIIFHVYDDGYFPGPDVWRTGRPVPTSGITQPPVLGFVLRRLYEEAKDTVLAEAKARALIGAADAWHRWFYAARDPEGTGLVAILHPWESGRDNSCDWDAALARVPTDGIEPYQRRDTSHVDAAQRPHKAEYDRYLWLVQRFRGLGWDNAKLHDASPFRVVDPGFNAILIRSDEDIAALGEALGMTGLATAARARVAKAPRRLRAAVERSSTASISASTA